MRVIPLYIFIQLNFLLLLLIEKNTQPTKKNSEYYNIKNQKNFAECYYFSVKILTKSTKANVLLEEIRKSVSYYKFRKHKINIYFFAKLIGFQFR